MLLCDETSTAEPDRLDPRQPTDDLPHPQPPSVLARADMRDALLAAVPSLRAFAFTLTYDPDVADDLVQDTILRAWANRGRFEAGTSLHSWLFTILRNAFLTRWRKFHREVEDPDQTYATRLCTPPEQPGRCDAQDMLRALAKLSVEQRQALLLVAAEGLSCEDAARVCGVAVGTIKSRVARARQRLAQLLAVEATEDLGPDRVTQAALQSAL